jgi:hypothetical protein
VEGKVNQELDGEGKAKKLEPKRKGRKRGNYGQAKAKEEGFKRQGLANQ